MFVENISFDDFKNIKEKNRDNLEIIDVREPDEYKEIHLKDSKLIPMDEINSRLDEIDWEKQVVFVCRTGARSGMVAKEISNEKRHSKNLKGGIEGAYNSETANFFEVS